MSISLICIYNDYDQLSNMLLRSLLKKKLGKNVENGYVRINSEVSLILIDNRSNLHSSAAQAYNFIVEKYIDVLGDILVFLHQDIMLDDNFFLTIKREFVTCNNQILGLAGIDETGTVFSNLKYAKENNYITLNQISLKKAVKSVDECCFCISKNMLKFARFDEETCANWHLYAVDLCYHCNLYHNTEIYALPALNCFHKYDGKNGLFTDLSFLVTMFNIARKYKKYCKEIYAPCYICKTNLFYLCIKLLKTMTKNAIAKIKL